MTVLENDFMSIVSCGAAEAADPRQSKDVYRSIEKRLVVGLMSWPRQERLTAASSSPLPGSAAAIL